MAKIRFFISSTFEDLKEHRILLLNAFASLKQEVEAMEYWGPDSQSPLDVCLEQVRKSDIYIGILGTRYGFEPDNKKSITQYEYEEAKKFNKKRFIYIIDENKHKIVFKDVDTGEKAIKLSQFKNEIESSIVRAIFSSPEDLTSKVITHCIKFLDTVGNNINSISEKGKSIEIFGKGAYDISGTQSHFDITPLLNTNVNTGITSLDDSFLQKVLMGGIIAKNISENNYSCLDGITTFDIITWNTIICLLKIKSFDIDYFIKTLNLENDPFKSRLLIALAGELRHKEVIEPICNKVLINPNIDTFFRMNMVHITPFTDTSKKSLLLLCNKESITILEKYKALAKNQKNWKVKKLFESIIKSLNQQYTI